MHCNPTFEFRKVLYFVADRRNINTIVIELYLFDRLLYSIYHRGVEVDEEAGLRPSLQSKLS